MIRVHHLENSRSQRVLWLLEELGLRYEVVRYARDPETLLAPPELRRIHPLGKSPVIEDDGLIVAESGAILEYLAETYDPRFQVHPAPDAPRELRLRYRYWMHYAEGSAMLQPTLALVFARIKVAPMPFLVRPVARGLADRVLDSFVRPQIVAQLDYLEAELGRAAWFCGDAFSAADVQMSFPIEAAVARGDGAARPKLSGFIDRIHARAAYKAALERGGPFSLLG